MDNYLCWLKNIHFYKSCLMTCFYLEGRFEYKVEASELRPQVHAFYEGKAGRTKVWIQVRNTML